MTKSHRQCLSPWLEPAPLFPQPLPSGPAPGPLLTRPRSPWTGKLILVYLFGGPVRPVAVGERFKGGGPSLPPSQASAFMAELRHSVLLPMDMPSIRQPALFSYSTDVHWLVVDFVFLARGEAQSFVHVRQVLCLARIPSDPVAVNVFRAPWLWLGLQAGTTKTGGFLFLCLFGFF